MSGTPARLRFSKHDDLDMLRDVRECNPFEDNMQHTVRWTEIAVRLSEARGKVFTARTVRDRTDLLLTQYADRDRRSLRRSGTEEEYSEQEQLLEEILTIAKENGYKIRAFKKTARTSGARSASGAKSTAALARDSFADAYEAANLGSMANVGAECAASMTATQMLSQMTNECDDDDPVLDDHPLPALGTDVIVVMPEATQISATESIGTSSAESFASTPASREDDVVDPRPAGSKPTRSAGKRNQAGRLEEADYEFVEKRMRHDEFMKQKDFLVESRRIALEEERLYWEKEKAENEMRLRQEELKQKAEDRAEERRLRAEQRAEDRHERAEERRIFFSILEHLLNRVAPQENTTK